MVKPDDGRWVSGDRIGRLVGGDWVGLGASWTLVISVSRSRLGGRGWGVIGGVPSELGCGRVKESRELFVFRVVDIEVAKWFRVRLV